MSVRFTKTELQMIEDLRKRLNMNTNGKMLRHIVLLFAENEDLDFILQFSEIDDLSNTSIPNAKGLLIEQIHLINQMLEAEGITNNQDNV